MALVKLIYDNNFLHVSAICHDNGKRMIRSLKRDNDGHWGSDTFMIAADPINEQSNGFAFWVNFRGVQVVEVLTVNSWGTYIYNNWDNKWHSKVAQF